MRDQEIAARRQADFIAAAVGRLGAPKKGVGATSEKKQKSASTSSSDLITAEGERNLPRTNTAKNT